jgi:hypothetical protein
MIKDPHKIIERLKKVWIGEGLVISWDIHKPVMILELYIWNPDNIQHVEDLRKSALWNYVNLESRLNFVQFFLDYSELGFVKISDYAKENKVLTKHIHDNKLNYDWAMWERKRPVWLVREK